VGCCTGWDGARDKLAEIFAHDADKEVEQCGAFLLGEARERGPEDVVGDRVSGLEDSFAGGSQVMFDPPTTARSAVDQALGGESVGECSKRLIALESLDGQCMGGGTGGPADGTQSIPLGKRRSHRGKPRIERSVMPVLHLLDGSTQRFQLNRHASSIPE